MRLDTRPGATVRFNGEGAYPVQNKNAREVLTVDGLYVVASLSVGNWESSVSLEGIDGRFNSVLFDNVSTDGKPE